ncbi:putative folate-biopterin transporter 2 [Platanthera guangdongensis]|uniref:Folate-biopterin transporter 2 n=1 Tax=Platanthera guangdongensis TaxID=2320717 RepID=A0ABR2MW56_9ASPA
MEDETEPIVATNAISKGTVTYDILLSPLSWLKILAKETHWSFVFGVIIVNGISQGLSGGIWRVATDYYWKDVQSMQPSVAQVYQGIVYTPWIVKPVWGLFTDVLPMAGYRRKPYLIFSGVLGVVSMLILSLHNLHAVFALLAMTMGSASVAIADVVMDACVAQNSIANPSLASNMQSLCQLSSSIGALVGFSTSGILIHAMGSQRVLGLLSIPSMLVFSVGILIKESPTVNFAYAKVHRKFLHAGQTMWSTLKCPEVWRPCVYMYISLSLSLNIHEGMFYWLTNPKEGPSFSQETIGFVFSIGSVGSMLGVLLYQNLLKDFQFRSLLFWGQLLTAFAGMLDLALVLRLNLKLGIPDFFFVFIDECVSHVIGRIKWMPILVLSSKLCPSGIEGTFFALVMSIENIGILSAAWGGGLLLHALQVTRTRFSNLWMAILIRSIMRMLPLPLLFLVPKSNQNDTILPPEMLREKDDIDSKEDIELASLVNGT